MAYNEAEVKRLLATPVKDLTPAEVEIVGFLLRQEPAMTERLLDEITAGSCDVDARPNVARKWEEVN